MIRPPPRSTRTYTPLPYTSLFRASPSGSLGMTAESWRQDSTPVAPGAGHIDGVMQADWSGRRTGKGYGLDLVAVRVADEGAEILCHGGLARAGRSEEHTSELQSLMRISYAVFCLKKKKIKRN